MLGEIFGRKKDEVSVQCQMLHNDELCDIHRSRSVGRTLKSRRLQTVHVPRMGETRKAHKTLMGKFLGRPRI